MPQTVQRPYPVIAPPVSSAPRQRVYSLSRLSLAMIIGAYVLLLGQRVFVGNSMFLINPDAMSYILGAQRAAQGHFAESISSAWMPGMSWFAAPLVFAGLSRSSPFLSWVTPPVWGWCFSSGL